MNSWIQVQGALRCCSNGGGASCWNQNLKAAIRWKFDLDSEVSLLRGQVSVETTVSMRRTYMTNRAIREKQFGSWQWQSNTSDRWKQLPRNAPFSPQGAVEALNNSQLLRVSRMDYGRLTEEYAHHPNLSFIWNTPIHPSFFHLLPGISRKEAFNLRYSIKTHPLNAVQYP